MAKNKDILLRTNELLHHKRTAAVFKMQLSLRTDNSKIRKINK